MPLARDVVKDLAIEHGACIRPAQLRRTHLDTGTVDQVLVPCGHTLAPVCPACAQRAKTLRAAQCREGWHLETEPVIEPDPATEEQKFWVEKERMGHASTRAALIYLHSTSERQHTLAEAVGERARADLRQAGKPAAKPEASGTEVARRRTQAS